MPDKRLNERAQQVMRMVVERYIGDGQPVGSKTLAVQGDLALSPATIRNVLSELEDKGYLISPHTSAGRIPTEKGYRFFIDSLLTVKPLDMQVRHLCEQSLSPDMDQQRLLQSASTLLSQMTRLVGVVSVTRRNRAVLRHIEFLPLNDRRILVILVFNEKDVQNRIITADRPFSASELEQAANYLNNEFAGKSLHEIRRLLVSDLKADRRSAHGLMGELINVVDQTFEAAAVEDECLVVGKTNLLPLAQDAGVERLLYLFDAFKQKRDILHLLDRCLSAEGVQIFVGQESGYAQLADCSVITAPYATEHGTVGVLGVIGPTRMPYHYVIPMVDLTARLLTAALSK